MKTSYSKVSSFSFCPKKFEFRYVLETPVPQKPELAFGVALHGALEENFAQKIDTRADLPLDKVLAAFHAQLEAGLASVPEDNLRGPNDFHYLRSMGTQFLEVFMRERAPGLQPAPRGVETFFKIDLKDGHQITGKFDLLDSDFVLHDFKTSNKPYDPRKADRTQLVIYAWACERIFGRYPKALCFDVFVKGDGADGVVRMQEPVMFALPSAAEMAQVAQKIESRINQIVSVQNSGVFPRSFEPLRCHWCEYQAHCLSGWEQEGRPGPRRLLAESFI
jgi:CRISPR/Cas system-associated exonuclease Cas4 (RecB family)